MGATPDHTCPDPGRMADLQRELAARTAERDAARTERDGALAGEDAIREVLQTINASSGDLEPVFEAILDKAHSLCGVAVGSLQL